MVIFHVVLHACAPVPSIPNDGMPEIYKPEKSIQCQPNTGVTEGELKAELRSLGIEVSSYRMGYDRNVYSTACGRPTGRIHIFSIRPEDVSTAVSAGFRRLENK